MTLDKDRIKSVDFINFGSSRTSAFLVRKPSTSFVKNIFTLTFSWQVWLAVLLAMGCFASALKIILNGKVKRRQRRRYTTSDAGLVALEAICQQGTTVEPVSFSGRIIMSIFFATFMFVYVSYSANIVVLLQSTTIIRNIGELLRSRMEVGGWNVHYMRNYFERTHDGILGELYLRKIYPNNYFTLEEGMMKVQDGNFAFYVSMTRAYRYVLSNFTNSEFCALQQFPGYIQHDEGHIAIQKNSPYKEQFKIGILRVSELGIKRRTYLRIVLKPECHTQTGTFKNIAIFDCHQVFWLWISGILFALLIFGMEMFVFRVQLKLHALNFDR